MSFVFFQDVSMQHIAVVALIGILGLLALYLLTYLLPWAFGDEI